MKQFTFAHWYLGNTAVFLTKATSPNINQINCHCARRVLPKLGRQEPQVTCSITCKFVYLSDGCKRALICLYIWLLTGAIEAGGYGVEEGVLWG